MIALLMKHFQLSLKEIADLDLVQVRSLLTQILPSPSGRMTPVLGDFFPDDLRSLLGVRE